METSEFTGTHNVHFDRNFLVLPIEVGEQIRRRIGDTRLIYGWSNRDKQCLVISQLPNYGENASSALLVYHHDSRFTRVSLPIGIKEKFNLEREATLIGLQDTFELWNTGNLERYHEEIARDRTYKTIARDIFNRTSH